jgi:hypothetical protein
MTDKEMYQKLADIIEANPVCDIRIDKILPASSIFLDLMRLSKLFTAVLRSDLVEMFLKCLFLAFLSSLYAVFSLGNFITSDLL